MSTVTLSTQIDIPEIVAALDEDEQSRQAAAFEIIRRPELVKVIIAERGAAEPALLLTCQKVLDLIRYAYVRQNISSDADRINRAVSLLEAAIREGGAQ